LPERLFGSLRIFPSAVRCDAASKLASKALWLDEIADELAHEKVQRGLTLAREAGFDAHGRVTSGKTWRAICEVGEELDAEPIVVGARGVSRVESALLGSGRTSFCTPGDRCSSFRQLRQAGRRAEDGRCLVRPKRRVPDVHRDAG
jgi:hypothetical protein